jgi:cation:H+ antiporter
VLLLASLLLFAVTYAVIRNDTGPFAVIVAAQILLFLSLIALIGIGADWLVESATRIADALGVSQLMIGLTVVAFGTSAPEGAVSLVAGFQGNGDITIANVVGSNIFNLCFILGGMALISSQGLPVRRELVQRDTPVLLLATGLLFLFVGGLPLVGPGFEEGFGFPGFRVLNLRLEFGEGIVLLLVLVTYLSFLYRARSKDARSSQFTHHWSISPVRKKARKDGAGESRPLPVAEEGSGYFLREVPMFLLGLFLVVEGCDFLVGHAEAVEGGYKGLGAVWFAKQLAVPDYVIGVTIVAAGTSTPEFVVSFMAALRGRFDMTIGNLIGSDIFNMLGVVGIAGVILQQPLAPPVTVAPSVTGSLLALSALVAVTWFFMRSGNRILRWEGAILVCIGIGRWTMDFLVQQPPAP